MAVKWTMKTTKMVVIVAVALMAMYCRRAEGQPSCVTKLYPCADYLNSTSSPSAACCTALRQEVNTDLPCICTALNDPSILSALNVTTDEAYRLAKSCGVSNLNACSGGPNGNDKGDASKANWIGMCGSTSLSLFWWSIIFMA